MTDIDELKSRRCSAYIELRKIHSIYSGIKLFYDEVKEQYESAKKRYENIDYELALIDGRKQVIENGKRGNHKMSLTPEQMLSIIQDMGIDIDGVSVVEDPPFQGEEDAN
jgi:hypothetical protein